MCLQLIWLIFKNITRQTIGLTDVEGIQSLFSDTSSAITLCDKRNEHNQYTIENVHYTTTLKVPIKFFTIIYLVIVSSGKSQMDGPFEASNCGDSTTKLRIAPSRPVYDRSDCCTVDHFIFFISRTPLRLIREEPLHLDAVNRQRTDN